MWICAWVWVAAWVRVSCECVCEAQRTKARRGSGWICGTCPLANLTGRIVGLSVAWQAGERVRKDGEKKVGRARKQRQRKSIRSSSFETGRAPAKVRPATSLLTYITHRSICLPPPSKAVLTREGSQNTSHTTTQFAVSSNCVEPSSVSGVSFPPALACP